MATLKNTVIHVGYERLHINKVKKLKKWAANRYWGTQEVSFSVKNIRHYKREEHRVTSRKEFLKRIKCCQRTWEKEKDYCKVSGGNRVDWTERVHFTALGYRASHGEILIGYYDERHQADEGLDDFIYDPTCMILPS